MPGAGSRQVTICVFHQGMAGGRAGAAARQAGGAAQSLRRQSEGGRHSKHGAEAEEGHSGKRGSVPRETRLWQAEGKAHWDTEAPRGHTGSPATTAGQRGWLDTQPPAGPSLLQGTKKAAGGPCRHSREPGQGQHLRVPRLRP